MLLSPCVLDYENKNDTAVITIGAPPDSYKVLQLLDNSIAMDLWITPRELGPEVTEGLPKDFLVVRSIY